MSSNKTNEAGVFITIYGPSKAGKSTSTGAAGACGLFIAQEGGLLPIKNFLGVPVSFLTAKNVEDAAKMVEQGAGKHPTIVVDDFSLLVEQTVSSLEQKHGFGEMWRKLRQQVLGMRDAARMATAKGTHVIFNCHESPPRTSSGKYVRGGPMMPGQLPEQFSAFSDIVARVVYDETAAPWKYVLQTAPDAEHICGDRLDILPDPAPMNIGEALRAAGYDIPRPKGLTWQDKVVDALSKQVLDSGIENWRPTLKAAAEKLVSKYDQAHVRWALQDSLHRAIIMNARENRLDAMFTDSEEAW
tara:strand:+ start:512 stop:1411 length:900 start_codon:yes stop_codon:yes gene_type:complete